MYTDLYEIHKDASVKNYLTIENIEGLPAPSLPLVDFLKDEFFMYKDNERMINILWTEMMFLSFFRKTDREYLRALHLGSNHDDFLTRICGFHLRNLVNRQEDLKFLSEPNSKILSKTFSHRSQSAEKVHPPSTCNPVGPLFKTVHSVLDFPRYLVMKNRDNSSQLKDLYQHYNELLHGKFKVSTVANRIILLKTIHPVVNQKTYSLYS